jgi:hypothetical protein
MEHSERSYREELARQDQGVKPGETGESGETESALPVQENKTLQDTRQT